MIHVVHQRTKYRKDRTPGEVSISGERVCFSLEDELRELPGVPVEQWKVKGKNAIPAGHYRVALEDSPRFGKETLTLLAVPGFEAIRIHGGNTEDDTEGCPVMGAELDAQDKIPGGKSQPGLKALKARLVPALKAGEQVVWDLRNPPGYQGPPIEAQEDTLPPQRLKGAKTQADQEDAP